MSFNFKQANIRAKNIGTSAGGFVHLAGKGFLKAVFSLLAILVFSGLCMLIYFLITSLIDKDAKALKRLRALLVELGIQKLKYKDIVTLKDGRVGTIGKFSNGAVEEFKGGKIFFHSNKDVTDCFITRYDIQLHERK
jgi:hypothetical protein